MRHLEAIQENPYGHRKKVLFFIERLQALKEKKGCAAADIEVLDVGCGNGKAVTLPLGDRGYSVTGLDFHEPSIEYAKKINSLNNVKYFLGDIQGFGGEAKYDVIVLSDVLEHIPDAKMLLLRANSLLRHDGIILISIPNGFGPFEIESALVRGDGKIAWWGRWASIGLWMLRVFVRGAGGFERIIRCNRRADEIKNDWGSHSQASPVTHGGNRTVEGIPYNYECGHVHLFSMRGFEKLIDESGYVISRFEKGCFNCGPLTVKYLYGSPKLIEWNLRVGRHLPYFLCSVWYFECRIAGGGGT